MEAVPATMNVARLAPKAGRGPARWRSSPRPAEALRRCSLARLAGPRTPALTPTAGGGPAPQRSSPRPAKAPARRRSPEQPARPRTTALAPTAGRARAAALPRPASRAPVVVLARPANRARAAAHSEQRLPRRCAPERLAETLRALVRTAGGVPSAGGRPHSVARPCGRWGHAGGAPGTVAYGRWEPAGGGARGAVAYGRREPAGGARGAVAHGRWRSSPVRYMV
uniref:Uncharacterized protein n=1 Tax=Setaria viridis TaxID=4556 RepID=A0A4U6U4Y8_SETVI|nr:translation initiation factor IF-2-like [Setaria viridis]TKW08743.1 hypothetical protein SEVIR_6G044466v2 [Setaria viridis]